MKPRSALWIAAVFVLGVGQAPAWAEKCTNFYPPDGPIFSGQFSSDIATTRRDRPSVTAHVFGRTIRYASFNIRYGFASDQLIESIRRLDFEKNLDFIMLQEVAGKRDGSANAAEMLARALGMNYTFSPAMTLRGRNYGNAVLSRWPLEDGHKIILPSSSWENCNLRAALSVTARIGRQAIQLYSVHLSYIFPDSFLAERLRARQVAPILDEVATLSDDMPVIVAGDFNSLNPWGWARVRRLFFSRGFENAHPTHGETFRKLPWDIDHAFSRGFYVEESGVDRRAEGSDHWPIWGVLVQENVLGL